VNVKVAVGKQEVGRSVSNINMTSNIADDWLYWVEILLLIVGISGA
jgi:hypothetical protein